jgi:ubiquinone biosynthesis protein Coq4
MKIGPLDAARALYRLARLVQDPNRLDEVFEMADALGKHEAIGPIVDELAKDPTIDRAFDEKHRIEVNLAELRRLPEGTLGRAFADHMDAAKLDPSALPTLPDDNRILYFRAHLYETHDIWHAVTGFGVDFVGELGLQGFYLAQIPGPLPALLVATGFVRSAIYDPKIIRPFMNELLRGWRMGTSARPFFGVKWDQMWSMPLSEVRAKLGIAEEDARAGGITALAA